MTEHVRQTEMNLSQKLKKELVEIAVRLEIPARGTKQEIIDRLMDRYWQDRR